MTKKIIIVVIAIALMLMTSCSPAGDNDEVSRLQERIRELEDELDEARNEKQKEENPQVGKAEDYFPLAVGNRWSYEGYGNEYAEYSEEIIYTKDGSYQSIIENPGTNLVKVYLKDDDKITITYEQGEVYDRTNVLEEQSNANYTLIQGPVKTGTTWENGGYNYEITTTNISMKLEGKIYKEIIEVKITPEDTNNKTEMYRYYAKGVGLVKMVYVDGENRIESVLREYEVK